MGQKVVYNGAMDKKMNKVYRLVTDIVSMLISYLNICAIVR